MEMTEGQETAKKASSYCMCSSFSFSSVYFTLTAFTRLPEQNIDGDTYTRPPVASDISEAARLGNGEEKEREVPAEKKLSAPLFL